MRSVIGLFGVYLLALLIAGSFPVSASDSVHGGAMLHSAFPHLHAHHATRGAGSQAAGRHASLSAAFESSAAEVTQIPGFASIPPLPRASLGVLIRDERPLVVFDAPWPSGISRPPPDRPPTSAV